MKEKQVKRLFDILSYQQDNYGAKNVLAAKRNGVWSGVSTKEYIQKADLLALALLNFGLKKEDKVGIIVQTNRPEWHIVDMAVQQIGAILVPIYATISKEDYLHIFKQAEIKLCIVSDGELYQKIRDIKPNLPDLQEILTFEPFEDVILWSDFLENGKKTDPKILEACKKNVQEDDVATIIYTSGTTGLPKGVMLTHKNILNNVKIIQHRVPKVPKGSGIALSFLPICHIYERTLTYMYQYLGMTIYFAESLEKISDNAKEVHPHFFTTVPRVVEKVYDKILAKASTLEGLQRKIFFWALKLAENYQVEGNSLTYRLQLALARKLVFKKWQEALGGNIKALVSGSAGLSVHLMRVFWAAGIPILEGYGLTETSPVIAVNSFEHLRFGSVGKVLENVEVRIAPDGEILTKSDCVMKGYYKNPEKTAEVFDQEGFFYTGDIGKLEDGYLTITDRKKEMFKTSGGKYIAPQVMENSFKKSPFIEQIMIVGEGQKFPAALIVPQLEVLKPWVEKKGLVIDNIENLLKNSIVLQKMQEEVDKINEHFGQWEKIKKFVLLSEAFSQENGLLTPTLKLKRKIITEKYLTLIQELYKN